METRRPVLIAGPNLTIDRTLTIEELRPGDVLRFESVAVTPGGKGVNVARVARALGAPALVVGFTPGRTGAAAAELLADEGLRIEPVPTAGELRSTAVILERGGRVTVMNEPGPAIGPEDWERYEAAVASRLEGSAVLVCSGSVPPETPPDGYGRLVELAAAAGAAAIVDTSGPALGAALQSRPAVACPNLAEAEGLLHGRTDETVEPGDPGEARARAADAAVELVQRGARAAVVSAGAAGAAVADGSAVIWHPAHALTVRNPIGAGDALVSGLASALEQGEPLERAVRAGLATAAASVETATAGEVDPARVAELEATGAAPQRVAR
jgi:1-phosphofructokinase family hexose kinase